MEIKLSHAGLLSLFTPSITRLVRRFPVSFMETLVRCHGAIGHMVSLLWIPVCLYKDDGSRGTVGLLMCHVLNPITITPLLVAPYSMALSAPTNESWSAIISYHFFNIIYYYFFRKGVSLIVLEVAFIKC